MKRNLFFKGLITTLLLVLSVAAFAQQRTVSGTVTSSDDQLPIPSVNISVKGTVRGTASDFDGNYSIAVNSDDVLVFSFVGFITQEITVGNRTNFDVVLQPDAALLGEVVVTALGISREKSSLTYAVDEVGSTDLTTVKQTNVVNSLSGRVAGLIVNRSGSGVGGSARVVIRGNKSTTNNQPLYVVDGVPIVNTNGGTQGGVFGGGVDSGDGISNINPEDIESMSVLKGASAAALYGSQAANGVILITTKRGAAGAPKITVSSSYMNEKVKDIPDMQFKYGQTSPGAEFSWGGVVNAEDHVEDFFQSGNTFINSISVGGGNETQQSFFSYANTTADGVMPTNDLKRHNFSFNTKANFFNGRLKLNGNVSFINQEVNNRPAGGLYFNPLTGLYFFPRGQNFNDFADNYEVYDQGRNLMVQNWVADRDIQQNPYWILNRNTNQNTRNRVMSTISVGYELADWLSVQARGSVDKSLDHYTQHVYASTQATLSDSNGRYVLRDSDDQQTYGDLIFTINKDFSRSINFSANVGMSHTKRLISTTFVDSKDGNLSFANQFGIQYLANPLGGIIREDLTRVKRNAVFASANLGINSTYYFDVTARNDWSSTLPNESYFYPSFGFSTVLSELISANWLDFAKARISYAIVGNDVPAYLANDKSERGDIQNGQLVLSQVGPIPGTSLVPEESRSFEIGLEMNAFDNRAHLDVTYYKTNTIDQFINISAPAGSGFQRYLVNAGDVQNSGIEALVSYDIVKKSSVTWNASLNFTKNTNEVKEVHPEFDENDGVFFITDESVNSYRMGLSKGGSFGDIYGVQFVRDGQGRIQLDADGRPQKGDFGLLGNPQPDYMYGFDNVVTFKGFTVRALIEGRVGGQVMSMTEALLDEYGVSQRTADDRDAGGVTVDAVAADGTPVNSVDAELWYGAVGGRNGITENYVYDATNVRLREFSIGYDFPASTMSRISFLSSIRFSLIGRNLFFLKNDAPFDPDVTFSTGVGLQGIDVFSLPPTRSFGFNLTLGF